MPGFSTTIRAAGTLAALLFALAVAPSAGADESDTPLQVNATGTNAIRRTQTIRGDQGGMLVAGRFWLWVPAGAWSGPAEVALSVPEPGRLVAEVTVDPLPAGGFRIPVHLFVGLADGRDLQTATLAAWNADRRGWQPFEEVARDTAKRELQVVLSRPARCAVLTLPATPR